MEPAFGCDWDSAKGIFGFGRHPLPQHTHHVQTGTGLCSQGFGSATPTLQGWTTPNKFGKYPNTRLVDNSEPGPV